MPRFSSRLTSSTDNIRQSHYPTPFFKLSYYRFHDLRHTFGSLLIQDGASLAYVKEQMGHSSIKITVDTYGHLIPGADIKWVDGLDRKATPQQNATPAQLLRDGSELTKEDHLQAIAALEDIGGRGSSRANELLTAC